MEENHYRTLGVPRKATRDEIEAAYRKFMQTVDPKYVAVIKAWSYAYYVLRDEARRKEHDLDLSRWDILNENKAEASTSSYASSVLRDEFNNEDESNNTNDNYDSISSGISSKDDGAIAESTGPKPSVKVSIEDDVRRFEQIVCRNFFLIAVAIVPLILIVIGWFDIKDYSFEESPSYPIRRSTFAGSKNLIGSKYIHIIQL